MKPRILVIDDEAAIRDSLRMILEYEGYDVQGAATGQDGLTLVDRDPPDLVFLDIKMAGMDGLEVLQRLQGRSRHPAGRHDLRAMPPWRRPSRRPSSGAFDFIEKPLSTERVLVTVSNALDQLRLVDENVSCASAQEVRHQLVGDSAALRRAARCRATRGAHQRDRAHHGRKRRRQGARGAGDSSQQPARAASGSSR